MCILWRGEHNEGDDGAGEYTEKKYGSVNDLVAV